jgi:hypothetical protein
MFDGAQKCAPSAFLVAAPHPSTIVAAIESAARLSWARSGA